MRMLGHDDDKDDSPEVTWEDQQRINKFSKLNSRNRGLQEKVLILKQEKEALDDLSMELELADEDQPVLYRVGESFLHLPHPHAMRRLKRDAFSLDAQLEQLTSSIEDSEKEMKSLKVTLYAKFGSAINLDE